VNFVVALQIIFLGTMVLRVVVVVVVVVVDVVVVENMNEYLLLLL